jgi:N utilization substance protein A
VSTQIISKISNIIDELVEEKGIDKNIILKAIIESIHSVYEKKHENSIITIEYNKKDDSLVAYKILEIVEKVTNSDKEISLKKAQNISTSSELGEKISIPLDDPLTRVEILKIKKIINQKIKEFEAEVIYKEFADKKDTIINGTINKIDETGALVLVYGFNAFLPRKMMIGDERFTSGSPVKAIIREVFQMPRIDGQILLDRSKEDFIQKLLELEIPEIFDGIVRIEKIVRVGGYKTKVLVSSRDSHINPVGTCIGMGGVRIKSILKELGQEKLDIIALVNKQEDLVAQALKPATVQYVEIKGNTAYITIDPEQRSIAVGKMGKNVYLASQLTGFSIEIIDGKKNTEQY